MLILPKPIRTSNCIEIRMIIQQEILRGQIFFYFFCLVSSTVTQLETHWVAITPREMKIRKQERLKCFACISHRVCCVIMLVGQCWHWHLISEPAERFRVSKCDCAVINEALWKYFYSNHFRGNICLTFFFFFNTLLSCWSTNSSGITSYEQLCPYKDLG